MVTPKVSEVYTKRDFHNYVILVNCCVATDQESTEALCMSLVLNKLRHYGDKTPDVLSPGPPCSRVCSNDTACGCL